MRPKIMSPSRLYCWGQRNRTCLRNKQVVRAILNADTSCSSSPKQPGAGNKGVWVKGKMLSCSWWAAVGCAVGTGWLLVGRSWVCGGHWAVAGGSQSGVGGGMLVSCCCCTGLSWVLWEGRMGCARTGSAVGTGGYRGPGLEDAFFLLWGNVQCW